MYREAQPLIIPRAEVLGDHDRRAGGKAGEKAYHKADYGRRAAAHRRERVGADEFSDDYSVYRIIKLLKQHTNQNREEKRQQFFPNNALRQVVFIVIIHSLSSFVECLCIILQCKRLFKPKSFTFFRRKTTYFY